MSRSAQTLFLLFITLFATQVASADDLFSAVSISSVFSKSAKDDDLDRQRTGRRLTGGHSIQRMLSDAGFIPTDLDDGYMGVDMEMPEAEGSKILVAVNLTADHSTIQVSASLVKVDSDKTSSAKLQKLLRSHADTTDIYYEYSSSSNWLRARWRLANEHVSSAWLKTKMTELIEEVSSDRETWEPLGKSLQTVIADGRRKKTLEKFNFAGTWTAKANGSRYGFKFDGKTFKLGIVMNGKITKSQGTWKVVDGNLQLVSDGMVIKATVDVVSTTEIEMRFGTQPTLKFARK